MESFIISSLSGLFFNIILFVYLFLAVLGLCGGMGFPAVVDGDHSQLAVHRPLIELTSLVAVHGLNSCDS